MISYFLIKGYIEKELTDGHKILKLIYVTLFQDIYFFSNAKNVTKIKFFH